MLNTLYFRTVCIGIEYTEYILKLLMVLLTHYEGKETTPKKNKKSVVIRNLAHQMTMHTLKKNKDEPLSHCRYET